MALALAVERNAMPPTPASWDPRFRAGPGWEAYPATQCNAHGFAAIPHAMVCFGAPAGDAWAARGEHHEHPVRAQRPIRHRPMLSEVGRGTVWSLMLSLEGLPRAQ